MILDLGDVKSLKWEHNWPVRTLLKKVMKQTHLFNDHIYEIHSHAVARNPIFLDRQLCFRFLEKLEKYLNPLCTVLHYSFHKNQFRMLVKLKSREAFLEYERMKNPELEEGDIKFTTHIFSQAMANLLSSMAIHFNRKYGRTGALFARRFFRRLIKSEQELEQTIESINQMKKIHKYRKAWKNKYFRRKKKGTFNMDGGRDSWEWSGVEFYRRLNMRHPVLANINGLIDLELRGQFKNLPPKSIYEEFETLTIKIFKRKPI